MSRTPAKLTQADVARVIRAAKQAGAKGITVLLDGTIQVDLQASNQVDPQDIGIAPEKAFTL